MLNKELVKSLVLFAFMSIAVQAQSIVTVSATNREASKPAAYIFEVVFDSEVRRDSRIDITFPAAFNTNMVMMAVSEKMDGNLNATVKDNVVSLTRRNGKTSIAAGQPIDLKLASIINPSQSDKEWDFTVALYNGSTETSKQSLRSRVEQFTKK